MDNTCLSLRVQLPTPCERLRADLFERAGVEVTVKRDDLIHPGLTGNKYRKLVHQLPRLKQAGTGATFGGAGLSRACSISVRSISPVKIEMSSATRLPSGSTA